MRETTTREIEGHKYTCTTLPALKGFALGNKLALTFGGEIAMVLFGALDSSGELDLPELIKRMKGATAMGLLDRLLALDEDLAQKVMLELLQSVHTVNDKGERGESALGNEKAFNAHFSDRGGLKRALYVTAWAGEVNFRHFFDASPSQNGGAKSQPESQGDTAE